MSPTCLEPWPKLWVNLRASCRTDVEEEFPTHVCNAWLGHSKAVADKHYLRVKPEYIAKANGESGTPVNKDNTLGSSEPRKRS